MPSDYVSPRVAAVDFAVNGPVVMRALQIKREMAAGKKFPFDKIIFSNQGNPQLVKAKPLTYPRQVLSLIDSPFLFNQPEALKQFPPDVVARARESIALISGDKTGMWGTGAYTHPQGYDWVRKNVATFITERDRRRNPGLPESNFDHIYLCDGATNAVRFLLEVILADQNDAVMIPIPQYPMYGATISTIGGSLAPYILDENNEWSITEKELTRCYDEFTKKGKKIRALCVVNPGNPTGTVFDRSVIEMCSKWAHERDVIIIADEVYQDNIYREDKPFFSFREVVLSTPGKAATETMVVSLHSASKGILGECGRRGSYMELLNISAAVREQILKLMCVALCANVSGQVMVDMMVKRPKPGDYSYESFTKEYDAAFKSLQRRAIRIVEGISSVPGMKCTPTSGAMYAYVSLTFPKKFFEFNEAENRKGGPKLEPDERYAMMLLERAGIVVIPGSGFGQLPGTYHFRTTILPPENEVEDLITLLRTFQTEFLARFGPLTNAKL